MEAGGLRGSISKGGSAVEIDHSSCSTPEAIDLMRSLLQQFINLEYQGGRNSKFLNRFENIRIRKVHETINKLRHLDGVSAQGQCGG